MASSAKRDIAAMPGRWRATGVLQAGHVLGVIGTLMLAILLAAVVYLFVLMR